jgi:hypothetical protein
MRSIDAADIKAVKDDRMVRRHNLVRMLAIGSTLALLTGSAEAERIQRDNVIVVVNGGIKPRTLPRRDRVPVTVSLSGGVRTSDGSSVPRVNWIRLELAWRGAIFTKGLPVCPRTRLISRSTTGAMQVCGDAIVGRGALSAQVLLPNQNPFDLKANFLLFNGKTKAGRTAIWGHAYTRSPPSSFVIPFKVLKEPGRTILIATIRRSVGPYPHVAGFHVEVARHFKHNGKSRSYLTANCPIPRSFTAGFLSFARVTYGFANGERIKIESVRSCRAR